MSRPAFSNRSKPERAAEIIEEMSPDEAAHALAELEEETSSEILEELTEESKSEVSELIEYRDHTAGALMNTEYVALPTRPPLFRTPSESLRRNEELLEVAEYDLSWSTRDDRLTGAVPLARLFIAPGAEAAEGSTSETLIRVTGGSESENRVTELFDKYNVLTLPVIDEEHRLAGVITADDIISVLRQK